MKLTLEDILERIPKEMNPIIEEEKIRITVNPAPYKILPAEYASIEVEEKFKSVVDSMGYINLSIGFMSYLPVNKDQDIQCNIIEIRGRAEQHPHICGGLCVDVSFRDAYRQMHKVPVTFYDIVEWSQRAPKDKVLDFNIRLLMMSIAALSTINPINMYCIDMFSDFDVCEGCDKVCFSGEPCECYDD